MKNKSYKKILFCLESIASGGVEKRRLLLIRFLLSKGFVIKIVCTKAIGKIAHEIKELGVEVLEVGPFSHPFHFRKHRRVYQLVKKFRPDIIHGAVFEGMSIATISGFLGRVPVILLEETSDPQNRSALANMLLKIWVRISDMIISISPEVSDYLINVAKIPQDKIRLVQNGIEVDYAFDKDQNKELKMKLGIEAGDFVVGFVGRIYNDHKRISDLIDALVYLEKKQTKLLIVGSGPDLHSLENLVKELNLTENVIFAGLQENTNPFYHLMDVLCVPSSREGFGLVAIEGMMHKLPIVASKVGGLQGIVDDDITGYLIPPFQPKTLAEKIKVLKDNERLRLLFGEAGFKKASIEYSGERYLSDIWTLYEGLLKTPKEIA